MFEEQAEIVEVAGRELRCLICGHDRFTKREAKLNTAFATFFNMDWTNPSGMCVVCENCGYIHWFMQ